jgi:hypothetical protein
MTECRAEGERDGERGQELQNESPTLVSDLRPEAFGLKDSEVSLGQRPCRAAFAPFIRSTSAIARGVKSRITAL